MEISNPLGAVSVDVSPLPRPLPLTVKLVVAPAVPAVVAGNVSEVVLTFSAGAGLTVPLTEIDLSTLT